MSATSFAKFEVRLFGVRWEFVCSEVPSLLILIPGCFFSGDAHTSRGGPPAPEAAGLRAGLRGLRAGPGALHVHPQGGVRQGQGRQGRGQGSQDQEPVQEAVQGAYILSPLMGCRTTVTNI